MLNYMSQLTYLYGICFCKLAVGASLLRIASTKFWKHLVLGVMIFVFAYTTAGFVVSGISELFSLTYPLNLVPCRASRTNADPDFR